MSPKSMSLWIIAVACLFGSAAGAQGAGDVLAKIASENPKQPVALAVNFRPVATQAQLMEFARTYSIDVMQVTARLFTNGGEAVFTVVSLSATVPAEQLAVRAKCAFEKWVGTFSYPSDITKAIKAELGAENRWWFSDSIVMTSAEEALRLAQSKLAFVQQIKPYGVIPVAKFDVAKAAFKDALISESCDTKPSLGIF